MPLKIQSGMRFGEWEVIERDYHPTSKQHSTFWFCKCHLCDKIYSVSRDSLVSNKSSCCNHCKGEKIKDKAQEKGLNVWRKGDRFGLLTILGSDGAKGRHSYVKCQCDCGNILSVRTGHLRGQNHARTISCGCASQSSGELKIIQLLTEYNIDFKTQYRISDFNISSPFDFALFQNGKLLGLIEYDGEQHFISVDFFGGKEKFKLQQQRDKNKNEWCKKNNIRLIRIPYTDYDNLTIDYLYSYFPELSLIQTEM